MPNEKTIKEVPLMIDDFQGLFKLTYPELPALSNFFDTYTSDSDIKSYSFAFPEINEMLQDGDDLEACGELPLNCTSAKKFEVFATKKKFINEGIVGCLGQEISRELLDEKLERAQSSFIRARLQEGFSAHNTVFEKRAYSGDVLSDLMDDITEFSELYGNTDNLVIVASQKVRRELIDNKIKCCDYMTMMSTPGSVLFADFKINGIFYVESALLGAGSDDEVAYQLYYRPASKSLEACVTPVHILHSPETDTKEARNVVRGISTLGHEVITENEIGRLTGIVRIVDKAEEARSQVNIEDVIAQAKLDAEEQVKAEYAAEIQKLQEEAKAEAEEQAKALKKAQKELNKLKNA